MKHGSTVFLKVVILLIAIATLIGLIVFPQLEGRATNLNLLSIYSDPFIIFIYIASTPFFIGLYQALKLLNLIDANQAFSRGAVNTLKKMKFISLVLVGFITLAQIYIRFFVQGEDPAGPTMLGIIASFVFIIIAITSGILQKLLQNAVDLKTENDLTV
jgi:hypothetical protein